MKVTKADKKVLGYLEQGKTVEDVSKIMKISKLDIQFSIIRLKRAGIYKEKKDQFGQKIKEKPPAKTEKKDTKKTQIDEEGLIETGADKLYDLIYEKRDVAVKQAADELNVDVKIIEEWASIFEDHKLIEMNYPVFGKPSLRIKGFSEEKKTKRKRKIAETKEESKITKSTKFGKKKSKKPGAIIVILGIIAMFLYLGYIKRLPAEMNRFVTNIITFFQNLLHPITSTRIYFEMTIIIIIVVVIAIVVFKVKRRKLKAWSAKRKLK